jgi:hypothetical protein
LPAVPVYLHVEASCFVTESNRDGRYAVPVVRSTRIGDHLRRDPCRRGRRRQGKSATVTGGDSTKVPEMRQRVDVNHAEGPTWNRRGGGILAADEFID